MSWWVLVPPIAAGIALVMIPGLVIAYAATARGITAWGLAPGLSMTVYTVLALIYGVPHLTWNLGTVTLGVVVVVAVVALVTRWLTRRFGVAPLARDPRTVGWVASGATVIAFLAVAIRFAYVFAAPDGISQTFDNNFHLNGMRYIIDTGEASPLTFSDLQYAFHGFGSFYPNLWHAVAALIAELSGASVPVTANAFSIVIGGVIWPLSCVFLIRQVMGPRPLALLAGGVMSIGLAAFPLTLVSWGVLYPNLLGLALVPAGLGTLVLANKLAADAVLGPVLGWIAFVALLPGIALAHPNALVSLLVVGMPPIAIGWWRWLRWTLRETGRRRLIVCIASGVVGAAVLLIVFWLVRPPSAAATWGPIEGRKAALYMGLLNAEYGDIPAFVVTALAIVGVVATFVKRRNRWLVISAAAVELLFYLTATLPLGHLRLIFTGTWYSDIYRIIALFPLVLAPLATVGVIWLGELAAQLLRKSARFKDRASAPRLVAIVTVVLVVVLGGAAQLERSMVAATGWAKHNYALTAKARLLSTDERALIERLPGEVPADAVIAGDPWTGTALTWALADRRVIAPHIYGARSDAENLILQSLRSAKPDSAVCRAVHAEGVTYALDFGTKGVFGHTDQYPGVHHLSTSAAVALVDHVGDAALYRITGCN
ncbi:DUF6541 family protein [Rathayibacter sp. CAU 1779]